MMPRFKKRDRLKDSMCVFFYLYFSKNIDSDRLCYIYLATYYSAEDLSSASLNLVP